MTLRETKQSLSPRGTGSSNPSPSSGESANFRFLNGGARIVEKLSPIVTSYVLAATGCLRRRRCTSAGRDDADKAEALYAPPRPTEKHLEPLTPFADYVARRREDRKPQPAQPDPARGSMEWFAAQEKLKNSS